MQSKSLQRQTHIQVSIGNVDSQPFFWQDCQAVYEDGIPGDHRLTTELVKIAEAEMDTHQLLVESKQDALNPSVKLEKATGILNNLGLPPNSDDSDLRYIHAVLTGHLLLLEGAYKKAIQVISSVPEPSIRTLNYVRTAIFRGHAVTGSCLLKLGDKDGALKTFNAIYPSTETLNVNAEAGLWSERMYFAFVQLTQGTNHYLDALRSYSRVFMFLDSHGHSLDRPRNVSMKIVREFWELSAAEAARNPANVKLKEEALGAARFYGKNVLAKRRFPTAAENNDEVERFVSNIMATWRSSIDLSGSPYRTVTDSEQVDISVNVLEQLVQAAHATFHSSVIMRYHVVVLGALGRYTEALAAFETYSQYVDQQLQELTSGGDYGGHLDSDEGVVEAFDMGIHIYARVKKDPQSAKAVADKLAKYMPFSRTSDAKTLEMISSKAVAAISSAYCYYAYSLKDNRHYEEAVSVALKGFRKALDDYSVHPAQVYYEYALLSAVNGDVVAAFEIVKSGLQQDGLHVPSWHLLALLLSSQEDYHSSFKTTEQAWAVLSRAKPLGLYSNQTKAALLELEKSRVAVIEASSSPMEAVLELSTVFTRFSQLFPDSTLYNGVESEHQPHAVGHENVVSANAITAVANSKANGSNRKSLLNGYLSDQSKSKANGAVTQVNGSEAVSSAKEKRRSLAVSSKPPPEKKAEAVPTRRPTIPEFERRVQIRLWLWVAGLYRRAGNVTEAERALVEAEHLESVVSPDAHCELGYLMKHDRPLHALQEFEAALDTDPDSLGAAIGLAEVVESHSNLRSHASLPEDKYSVFISDKDEYAAHFRAIGLLEALTSRTPGRTVPEAWWLLGKLYDITNNAEGARRALWKAVGLEECRATRSYFCTGYD
jgi:tetratricopeptide (TPR) repeat protein